MSESRTCPLSLEEVHEPAATPCCATVCERAYLEEALRRSPLCPLCRTRIGVPADHSPQTREQLVVRYKRRGRALVDVGLDASAELRREVVNTSSLDANVADAVRASLGVDTRPMHGYAGGAYVPLEGTTVRAAQQLVYACDADSLYVLGAPRPRRNWRTFRPQPRPVRMAPPPPSAPTYTARYTQSDVNRLFNKG